MPKTTKTKKTREVPAAACSLLEQHPPGFRFDEGAGEPGAENPRAGFTMDPVASGNAILGHWFWGNLALDLEGVELPDRQIPALKDHDPDQRAGFTTSLEVRDGVGLCAAGELLKTSEAAREVQADAAEGFPWQSSVHAVPLSVQMLDAGETADVNGYTLEGPGAIFRAWKVREVSFTALGADDSAAAAVASSRSNPETYEVPMVKKTDEGGGDSAPSTDPTTPAELSADEQPQTEPTPDPTPDPVAAERERVAAILSETSPEQSDLARTLIADGVELSDARATINADLRERLAAAFAAPEPPVSRAATPTPAPADSGDPRTRFAAEFDADEGLREEFASRDDYVAFRLLESRGQIRRLSRSTAPQAAEA